MIEEGLAPARLNSCRSLGRSGRHNGRIVVSSAQQEPRKSDEKHSEARGAKVSRNVPPVFGTQG
eukprot:4963914-Prymnesium_polylepis.1